MGVGASDRFSAVRWGVAGNIVVAWILTLPAAASIGALTYGVTRLFGKGAVGPTALTIAATKTGYGFGQAVALACAIEVDFGIRIPDDDVTAVDDDFGVRREDRLWRQFATAHPMPADGGLGARDALDVFERSFVLARDFDDVASSPRSLAQQQLLEFDTDLAQQFLPARAFRSQIDRRTLGQREQRAHSRWYGCPDSMLVARYNCSASTTRASPCGNVSTESARTASASRLTPGSRCTPATARVLFAARSARAGA